MARAACVATWVNTEDRLERQTHCVLVFVALGLTHAKQVRYRQHGKFGVSVREPESFLVS